MIEWYGTPEVIGSLFTDSTNRSLGSSVSTLLGIRFTGRAAGSAIRNDLVEAYKEERDCDLWIREAPSRPIQPEASSLPR